MFRTLQKHAVVFKSATRKMPSATVVRQNKSTLSAGKIRCDLYDITPTARLENELRDIMGTSLNDTTPIDHIALGTVDSMHYMGHEGTSKMLGSFGEKMPRCILDMGSGFGGCSRFVANATASSAQDCHVTALELQPEISDMAKSLTDRCGLAHIVSHVTGNATNAPPLPREGEYELAFSKLVLCHVPFSLRSQIWQRAQSALAPRGVIYVEDFFAKANLTKDELVGLEDRIGVPSPDELPTREQWVAQLEAAGFRDVDFVDATNLWAPWVTQRAEVYRANRERNLRVQGEPITDSMQRFYDTVATLFNAGHFGGCVVQAVKV